MELSPSPKLGKVEVIGDRVETDVFGEPDVVEKHVPFAERLVEDALDGSALGLRIDVLLIALRSSFSGLSLREDRELAVLSPPEKGSRLPDPAVGN